VKVKVQLGDETHETEASFQVVSGNYKVEILPVNPRFVTISPEDQARIEADSKIVGEIYRNSAAQPLWVSRFQKPILSKLTSRFGNKRMFNGELQSFHTGADLKAATGTEVQAAAAGNVVLTKDLFFTGNTVIIDHGFGLFTVYAHLSQYRVKEGQGVHAGQVIAESGSTGRSSGPHLHWGAVLNRVKFDPLDLLKGIP
jgi:murein DD-endopeptidase MepM/ murein hydrolase activator NlpD